MKRSEQRKFYGSVTVSERGQVVVPAEARRDFKIKVGDKLLVFGDLEQGLGFVTFAIMQKTMKGTVGLFREIDSMMATPGLLEKQESVAPPKKKGRRPLTRLREETTGTKQPATRRKAVGAAEEQSRREKKSVRGAKSSIEELQKLVEGLTRPEERSKNEPDKAE